MLGGMQEHHKGALTKLRVTLLQEMVPEELIEHLLAENVLTPFMKEHIETKGVTFRRNTALLDLLPRRGPHAFSAFCTALRKTGQEHLAELLDEQVRNARLQETHVPLSVQESSPRGRTFRRDYQEGYEMSIDDGDGPGSVALTSVNFYLSHHKQTITLPSPVQQPTDMKQAYIMRSRPRGLALIISNIEFSTPELDYRQGGEVDLIALKQLFTHLNYRPIVCCNKTGEEMTSELEHFSALQEHSNLDSAIIAILSHGVDGAVYGTDGTQVQLQEIFTKLDNAHCQRLQNKPKMFFIQACRGEEADRGVDQRDGREQAASPGCEQSDAGREDGKIRLPTQSDMICAYACLRGTVSLRNTKRGSWFIQDLTEVFSKHAKDTHVADMLVKVNACIKKREGHAPETEYHRCKEMSEYSSTLCKDLYLFPGL